MGCKHRISAPRGPKIARRSVSGYVGSTRSSAIDRDMREVLPDGIIETVAGGGRLPLPDRAGEKVPALRAALPDPLGVALGPRGSLAIAASLVVSLDRDGYLTWIAGSKRFVPWCRTCDIGEGNFYDADQLAYDGAGDLLVSSDNIPVGYGVAEVRANGIIRDIGGARGREANRPPSRRGQTAASSSRVCLVCTRSRTAAGSFGWFRTP